MNLIPKPDIYDTVYKIIDIKLLYLIPMTSVMILIAKICSPLNMIYPGNDVAHRYDIYII